jgi:hypothetical protein
MLFGVLSRAGRIFSLFSTGSKISTLSLDKEKRLYYRDLGEEKSPLVMKRLYYG